MYHAFVKAYLDSNIHQRFYRRVFRKSFPKLSFPRPRTDTCSSWDLLKNKINTTVVLEKLKLIAKKELHLRKAEKAVKLLNEDNTFLHACLHKWYLHYQHGHAACDIFTPTLSHSSMFYSRQLSNFNLFIHNEDTSTSFMCLWHEGMAGRGGNEVASCLLKVITSNLTPKRNLTVWCDNCAGQNKNRIVLMIMIYAVAKNILDCIEFKFLVSGHSYMPCDRDFGIIEKRKRLCKPMVPEEIAEMIAEARHVQPFNVVMMKEEDFYDIFAQCDTFLNTSPIKISTASWIKISRENLPIIQVKSTFSNMEPWKKHNIFKRGKSVNDISRIYSLPPLGKRSAISDPKKRLVVYVEIRIQNIIHFIVNFVHNNINLIF
ncbi:uncharacterized protein TNCT_122361 [Trichonephila clavata]|uniref:DUF7869 domain-containing protein n=1 Tax=Trichonephila clavata TaxID=2740835 RepID=A0A8X6KNR2_TRICU|nr:uncharacterized protein TNCT_122361 [Trichonephila clavata]